MKKGFTLVEIMIVVAIIGLLAAIAIPSFMKARTTSQKNACINNLRQIESAKDQYAMANGGTNGAIIGGITRTDDADSSNSVWLLLVGKETGYIKTMPACPASVSTYTKPSIDRTAADYLCNTIGSNATCQVLPGSDGDAHYIP